MGVSGRPRDFWVEPFECAEGVCSANERGVVVEAGVSLCSNQDNASGITSLRTVGTRINHLASAAQPEVLGVEPSEARPRFRAAGREPWAKRSLKWNGRTKRCSLRHVGRGRAIPELLYGCGDPSALGH